MGRPRKAIDKVEQRQIRTLKQKEKRSLVAILRQQGDPIPVQTALDKAQKEQQWRDFMLPRHGRMGMLFSYERQRI